MTRDRPHIVITDRSHGLPYSKGLMAASLTVSGLSPYAAFRIAETIEDDLLAAGRLEITSHELRDLAAGLLIKVSERFASTYMQWQQVEDLDLPLVILLGGATGVGKSTVATQLATRLRITRVVSTDAVREVLRSALSPEFMPVLHVSSFNADLINQGPLPDGADPVLAGFSEQVKIVAVGIKALIARALEEGTDMIIEGAHVVPGFLEGWEEEFKGAVLVPIVMSVGPEDLHRSHFHLRALESDRPEDRYLPSFEKIRVIQSHITELAKERNVPVVEAFDLDSTLQRVTQIVVDKAINVADLRVEAPGGCSPTSSPEARKHRQTKAKTWEVLGRRKNA